MKPISGKLNKLLKFPDLRDRVICFIPSWERHGLSLFEMDIDTGEYKKNEQYIFSIARYLFLEKGATSFLVFRALRKNQKLVLDKSDKELMEENYKFFRENIYKAKNARQYLDLKLKVRDMVESNFEIIEDNQLTRNILKSPYMLEPQNLQILCVDYKDETISILPNFIRYVENRLFGTELYISDELKNLYDIFCLSSVNNLTQTYPLINEIIEKLATNKLNLEALDNVEFLSENHLQRLPVPKFWKIIEDNGYNCEEILENSNGGQKTEVDDFRFFYSLEALLFWELKNCLKKVRRCKNCNAPLPTNVKGKTYTGSYCSFGSSDYEKCFRERLKNRQKKFREELKKY